jgi:type IV secretory pathway TrbF-like protein
MTNKSYKILWAMLIILAVLVVGNSLVNYVSDSNSTTDITVKESIKDTAIIDRLSIFNVEYFVFTAFTSSGKIATDVHDQINALAMTTGQARKFLEGKYSEYINNASIAVPLIIPHIESIKRLASQTYKVTWNEEVIGNDGSTTTYDHTTILGIEFFNTEASKLAHIFNKSGIYITSIQDTRSQNNESK